MKKDNEEHIWTQEEVNTIGKYFLIFQLIYLTLIVFVWYTGGFDMGNKYFQGFGKLIDKLKDVFF